MASSILQIILKVTKQGSGDKEAAKDAKALRDALDDLGLGSIATISALGALSAAVGAAVGFTRQAVDETVKYADEVRRLKQLTGESAEDVSRLVQLIDDYKISTDSLAMAQKALSKDGLSLTVETLAKLSEEYNQLGSGAEKTRFLVEKFGKTGLQFAEIMEQGAGAIREQGAAISENLILTERALKQTREYEKQLDSLNDQWAGVKMGVGTQVVPALNVYLDAVNKNIERGDVWKRALTTAFLPLVGAIQGINDLTEAHDRLNPEIDAATANYMAMAAAAEAAADGNGQSADEMAEAARQAEELAKQVSDANQSFLNMVDQFVSMEGKTADEVERSTRRIVLSMLERQLSMDGLNQAETNYLLDLGVKWGVYTESAAREARKAMDEVARLTDALNNVPEYRSVTIQAIYSGDFGQTVANANIGGSGSPQMRDGGGVGMPGQAYLIGTGAQPELFIPSTSGTFVPNADRIGGQNITVNLMMQSAVNLSTAQQAQDVLLPYIREGLRQVQQGR